MSDTVRVTFFFGLGQCVRWAAHTDTSWSIVSRQYHEGPVSQYVTYGLARPGALAEERTHTAYEPDLEAVEGEA